MVVFYNNLFIILNVHSQIAFFFMQVYVMQYTAISTTTKLKIGDMQLIYMYFVALRNVHSLLEIS